MNVNNSELQRAKADLYSLTVLHTCPKCRLKATSIRGRCLKCGVRKYPDEVIRLTELVKKLSPMEVAK